MTTSGNYVGESAWRDSSGGYSRYEPEPSYQQSVQSSGARSVPDVAFDANPATGVQVYESSPFSGRGSWQVVGGTSLGAPGWAAIIAIVDQGRSLQGMASLDGATQTLPQLYGLPSSDFHAVSQTGKAGSGPVVAAARIPGVPGLGRISATQGGANTVTGLGTPNGPLLVGALTNDGSTPPVVAAAVPISSPGLRIGVIPSFKARQPLTVLVSASTAITRSKPSYRSGSSRRKGGERRFGVAPVPMIAESARRWASASQEWPQTLRLPALPFLYKMRPSSHGADMGEFSPDRRISSARLDERQGGRRASPNSHDRVSARLQGLAPAPDAGDQPGWLCLDDGRC